MWIVIGITLILITLFAWAMCSSAKRADVSMDKHYHERIKSSRLKQNNIINGKGE